MKITITVDEGAKTKLIGLMFEDIEEMRERFRTIITDVKVEGEIMRM